MATGSNSPPSTVLGAQELEDLLTCGGCGHCIKCNDEDFNYVTSRQHSTPQRYPFTCYICNEHFETKILYDKHKGEHLGANIYECNYCDEVCETLEILTKHKNIEHEVADSKDYGNDEQDTANVEVASFQQDNFEPTYLVHDKDLDRFGYCRKGFMSDSSTDNTDPLESETPVKQLKHSAFYETLKQKGIFMQHEETNEETEGLQWTLLDHPSGSDSDVPNMAILKLNSSGSSSFSVEVSSNTSHSSVEETKTSPSIACLPEVLRAFWKSDGIRCPDKPNTLSRRNLLRGVSGESSISPKPRPSVKSNPNIFLSNFKEPSAPTGKRIDKPVTTRDDYYFQPPSSEANTGQLSTRFIVPSFPIREDIYKTVVVNPKPEPCEKSNERQLRSGLVEPTPSSCKEDDESLTSGDDPSGKADTRQLLPNLKIPSTYSLEEIFNIDQPTTSSENPSKKISKALDNKSRTANKRQGRPLFRIPSSSIGERIYETRLQSDSGDDKNDRLSAHEINARRLRALLELPSTSDSRTIGTDQPSTSNHDHCYCRPFAGSSDRTLSLTLMSS